jgi:ubiquitin-protein ligase
MKWVVDDPARFLKEKAEITQLENETNWLTVVWRLADGNIVLDFDMTIHGRVFEARMTYPDMFPNTPPYIRPRDASEHWSGHQYGVGGSLCLQWRADNWQMSVTGADMIRSAFALIESENHPEQPRAVLSEHQVTQGQAICLYEFSFGCMDKISSTFGSPV